MDLKIALQGIYTKSAMMEKLFLISEAIDKYIHKVARPDTILVRKYLKRSSECVRGSYLEFLNNFDVVEGIIQVEREGFDAAIIDCFNDPGLQVAREVVNIPVIGPCESSVHIACMLGGKFAIITNTPIFIPTQMELLRRYGVEGKAISRNPVRSCDYIFPTDYVEGIKDPYKSFIPRFEKVAKECIKDGADIIIPGCNMAELIFDKVSYREIGDTGVTIVFPLAIAIKMAESLADLQKTLGLSKSKAEHSPYGMRDTEVINQARKIYGLDSAEPT